MEAKINICKVGIWVTPIFGKDGFTGHFTCLNCSVVEQCKILARGHDLKGNLKWKCEMGKWGNDRQGLIPEICESCKKFGSCLSVMTVEKYGRC